MFTNPSGSVLTPTMMFDEITCAVFQDLLPWNIQLIEGLLQNYFIYSVLV